MYVFKLNGPRETQEVFNNPFKTIKRQQVDYFVSTIIYKAIKSRNQSKFPSRERSLNSQKERLKIMFI